MFVRLPVVRESRDFHTAAFFIITEAPHLKIFTHYQNWYTLKNDLLFDKLPIWSFNYLFIHNNKLK